LLERRSDAGRRSGRLRRADGAEWYCPR